MNPAPKPEAGNPGELAERIADYMATSMKPWPDEQAMREAVSLTVRLLYTEAIHEAYPLMLVAGQLLLAKDGES